MGYFESLVPQGFQNNLPSRVGLSRSEFLGVYQLIYSGFRATEVHGNVLLPKAGAHFHTSLA